MRALTESQRWLVIRCLLGLLVSVHGWHRILDHGVIPFAEYMETRLPLGYYLVFVLQAMEIVGSVIFAAGRCVTVLASIFAVIYSCSIYFYHSQFGWFQSGGEQNGAEYAFALVLSFLAVAIAAKPGKRLPSPSLNSMIEPNELDMLDVRSRIAWACLRYLIAFLVLMHVLSRVLAGSVESMASLMPSFFTFPTLSTHIALLATLIQACACIAIIVGRGLRKAFLVLASLFAIATIFHHFQFGWIVSGADKDGAEYSVMLLILCLCLASAYHRRTNEMNRAT